MAPLRRHVPPRRARRHAAAPAHGFARGAAPRRLPRPRAGRRASHPLAPRPRGARRRARRHRVAGAALRLARPLRRRPNLVAPLRRGPRRPGASRVARRAARGGLRRGRRHRGARCRRCRGGDLRKVLCARHVQRPPPPPPRGSRAGGAAAGPRRRRLAPSIAARPPRPRAPRHAPVRARGGAKAHRREQQEGRGRRGRWPARRAGPGLQPQRRLRALAAAHRRLDPQVDEDHRGERRRRRPPRRGAARGAHGRRLDHLLRLALRPPLARPQGARDGRRRRLGRLRLRPVRLRPAFPPRLALRRAPPLHRLGAGRRARGRARGRRRPRPRRAAQGGRHRGARAPAASRGARRARGAAAAPLRRRRGRRSGWRRRRVVATRWRRRGSRRRRARRCDAGSCRG
mmetsp:Transcript_44014/g.146718  ORF Transcript_44014/g.146718 Transcript_44014/m.146718 type:complete len:401 (+) Transcript_44014:1241-2443(+)